MSRTQIFCLLVLALTGCANPVNQHNAAKYHEWGSQAEFAGDYEAAERNYERALINARTGRSPGAGVSMVAYNLGRIKGYLCKYAEAETLLLEALQLEESASGPDSGFTAMRLFELARLHFDQGKFVTAASYYERAIPLVENLDIQKADPIGFANTLADYSIALARIGKSDDAAALERKAADLRAAHPNASPRFVPVRYNAQTCAIQKAPA